MWPLKCNVFIAICFSFTLLLSLFNVVLRGPTRLLFIFCL
uniref:Uncharacterized protein n=1 Tax=Rhizophora mucronata TaxID=61149 RepID=A0A2P2PEQ7_RHIMU